MLFVYSGVCVTRSLVLFVCFVDRFLSFFFWPLYCLFFFDLQILITSLWYLQNLFLMVLHNKIFLYCLSLFEIHHHTQKSLSHLNQNFQECSINGSEKALPWSCSDPKSNMAATGHFLIGWNINLYFFYIQSRFKK